MDKNEPPKSFGYGEKDSTSYSDNPRVALTQKTNMGIQAKGSRKNNFAELVPGFGSDLAVPIEQTRRNDNIISRILRRFHQIAHGQHLAHIGIPVKWERRL